MIEDAEMKGILKPGFTIIEPTSGNTGIGLALVGAVKGYNVIITLPDKMSKEKEDILIALGATVIRTPNNLKYEDPNSQFGLAKKLLKEIPNSVMLDQYSNPSNIQVHYDETAEEIWSQCEGKIDYIVMGVGTGGTITGIGRKLKEKNPEIKIVAVDPYGSILAIPKELNVGGAHKYSIEGIGYDFVPKNCDYSVIDQWIKVGDKDSYRMARRIIREEGLLVGGSSGSAMVGAIELAKDLPADKRVLVIFCDGITNYMSKFLMDDWMLEKNFICLDEYEELQKSHDISSLYASKYLISELDLKTVQPVSTACTINDVLNEFEKYKVHCLPVVDDIDEKIIGIITAKIIAYKLSTYRVSFDSPVGLIVSEDFRLLNLSDYILHLKRGFTRHKYIIVTGNNNKYYLCQPKLLMNHYLANNKDD